MTRSSAAVVAVVATICCALAGCGKTVATKTSTSSTTSTPTSTTSPAKSAAAVYVAAATKVDAALNTFDSSVDNWPSSETGARAQPSAQRAIDALKAFMASLENYEWPLGASSDILTLISAAGTLVGDLEGLAYVKLISSSSWASEFSNDVQSVSLDSNIVRHDLGLRSASSG
ncbi:MAG: hypothetical protein WAL04_07255 [Acidimicrobiales bacterium]